MKTVKAEDLQATVGTDLGVSDWIVIEQDRLNRTASINSPM